MFLSIVSIGISMSYVFSSFGGDGFTNHTMGDEVGEIHTYYSADLHSGKQHSGEMITLTFDDGPNPLYTPKILDILKRYHIPATFFVLGNRIPKNEKLLIRMQNEGYEIANHSYIHPRFSRLPIFRYTTEVWRTALMIWSVTNVYPTFFRFPYGDEDRRIGYFHRGPIIGWNVDAYDWKEKNPKKLTKNIVRQTQSGSIILLHDIRENTLNALPTIIENLEAEGYTFVPLRALIGYDAHVNYRNLHFSSATGSGQVGNHER